MTEVVRTWADSFGIWHARVSRDTGYTFNELARDHDRLRAKARRAIRREILARESGPIKPVRVVTVPTDAPGAVEFMEAGN